MSANIDLRSLLQATLTRHLLEKKAGSYQLFTADQIRVIVEDTFVDCPWGNGPGYAVLNRVAQPNYNPFLQQAGNPPNQQVLDPFVDQEDDEDLAHLIHQEEQLGINEVAEIPHDQLPPHVQKMVDALHPEKDLTEPEPDDEEEPLEVYEEDPKRFPRIEPHGNWKKNWQKNLSDTRCLDYMKLNVPAVVKVLEAHPGQLFLAGGCFADMIVRGYPTSGSDYDLFVCASDAQEAEKVMCSAAIILEREMKREADPNVDVYACTKTTTQATTFELRTKRTCVKKIQIIRRLYPAGRHDMIPGCFDLWPSQFIWSPLTGLQCTLPGLVSLIVRGFPIDLVRRSPAMAKRIEKYVAIKQFTCYLTGVSPECPQDIFGWRHPKCDSLFERFRRNGVQLVYDLEFNQGGMAADYDFANEEARQQNAEHQAMVKENPTVWDNLYNAVAGKPHIEIELKAYADFCTERCDLETSLFGPYREISAVEKMNRKTLKKFFKSETLRAEFCAAYFVDEDRDAAETLWAENRKSIAEPLEPLYCGKVDASKYWKVDNPGAQGFGQNCPRPIKAEDYYGDDYYPMVCGVPHHEVLAVRCLRKMKGWPLDVERLLCRHLLIMHANNVRHMLKL